VRGFKGADRRRLGRTWDFVLYVTIAAGFLATLWFLGGTDIPPASGMKWVAFATESGLVFGYGLKASWRYRHTQRWWLLLGVFFVAHLATGIAILLRVTRVPLLFIGYVAAAELILLILFLDRFLRPSLKTRRGRRLL
jgi:hypothetical protein